MNKSEREALSIRPLEEAGRGRIALSMLGRGLKILSLLLFLVTLIGVGQLVQVMRSASDVREHAIETWKLNNPQRSHLADKYIEKCIRGRHMESSGYTMDNPPISALDCGKQIGASDLARHIKSEVGMLTSTAWPLSLIVVNQTNTCEH